MPPTTQMLLSRIAARKRLALFGVRFYQASLVLAAFFGLLILVSRLLDWNATWFTWRTLLLVPPLAAIAAFGLTRRVQAAEAARLVDTRMGTKDLFLTSAMLDTAPGAYKPLVSKQAQDTAQSVQPRAILPFDWSARTLRITATMVVLLAATFIPTFDLFGHGEQRRQTIDQRRNLEEQKRLTEERVKTLQQRPLTEQTSEQVRSALEQLKQSLRQMKRDEPRLNLNRLKQQHQTIGKKWRQASKQNLARSQRQETMQQFGGADQRQAQQWQQQLRKGDASGLKQQMQQIRQTAKKLADTKDPIEKQQLRSQMQRQLQDLAEFTQNNGSSPALNAALRQAMEQLQMARQEGLSSESLEAFDESMQLSELEMEALAQAIRNQAALERALEALQLAKQLNAEDPLDGEACESCKTMQDYAELYKKLMAGGACSACKGKGGACAMCNGTGRGSGRGAGMGGSGIGRGNIAPEDPDAKTDFTPEKSRSAMTAGKILMQWKTKELAPAGEAELNYNEALEQVKQGYSEAVLQEQVPPGYHEAIRKYFDTLEPEQGAVQTK